MTDTRLELEATFKCPTCSGVPYKLFRRNTPEHPEIFTHVLWPTELGILPPTDHRYVMCPNDGATLVRRPA